MSIAPSTFGYWEGACMERDERCETKRRLTDDIQERLALLYWFLEDHPDPSAQQCLTIRVEARRLTADAESLFILSGVGMQDEMRESMPEIMARAGARREMR